MSRQADRSDELGEFHLFLELEKGDVVVDGVGVVILVGDYLGNLFLKGEISIRTCFWYQNSK